MPRYFGLVMCLFAPLVSADPFRSYHIGNSLTGDGNFGAAPSWAGSAGVDWDTAFHLRCNQSLAFIQANPLDTCAQSPGNQGYQTDIAVNDWDAITLQPFQTSFNFDSTMGTDLGMIVETIERARVNPSNASTKFYIYEAWPTFSPAVRNGFTARDWLRAYQAPVVDATDTPTVLAGEYFDALLPRVQAVTDATVLSIPVGDVIEELAIRYGDGLLPGSTFGETFYRDRVHLSYDIGRTVASMTSFAVMHNAHPMHITNDFSLWVGSNPYRLTPELQRLLADTVWEVVTNDPDTGVLVGAGDFDASGQVEQGDLDLVLTNWGLDTSAGIPTNWVASLPTGRVDQGELDSMLMNWGGDGLPDFSISTSVPEPTAFLPAFLAASCMKRNRDL